MGNESVSEMSDPVVKKKYRAITTEPILFLYSLALFTSTPTTSKLLLIKVCLTKFHKIEYCRNTSNPDIGDDDYIQDHTAKWSLYNSLAYFLPALMTVLYAGSWGDKFGRKFPLLFPPVGFVMSALGLAFVGKYIETAPLWAFTVSQIPSGLFGGELVIIASSFSYLSDVTDAGNRIKRLSVLQTMLTLAGVVGPLLSLGILRISDEFAVYCTTSALAIMSLIYTCFVLQRIDPVGGAKPINLRTIFGNENVIEGIGIVFKRRDGDKRKIILLLFTVFTIFVFTISLDVAGVLYLYLKDKPLSWTYSQYIVLSSLMAALSGFNTLVILPLMKTYFHLRDTTFGTFAAGMNIAGFVVIGFATNSKLIYTSRILMSFGSFISITCRTALSKLVEKNEQGKVFSLNAAVENGAFLTASLVFNSLWPITRGFFKGTLFEAMAFVGVIVFLLLLYLHQKLKKTDMKRDDDNLIVNEFPVFAEDEQTDSLQYKKQTE
ncbi:Uncharacterised protein g3932 [Pycnogonum litorale]